MATANGFRFYDRLDREAIDFHEGLTVVRANNDVQDDLVTLSIGTPKPDEDLGYGFEGEMAPAEARNLAHELQVAADRAEGRIK